MQNKCRIRFMHRTYRLIRLLTYPIERNRTFAFFMAVLAFLSCVISCATYREPHLHSKVLSAFIIDIYVLCAFIMLIPSKIREVIKAIICVFAYLLTVAESFCVENLSSTFNPSILQLIIETDYREISDFASTYLTYNNLSIATSLCILLAVLHIIITLNAKAPLLKKINISHSVVSLTIMLLLAASIARGGVTWIKTTIVQHKILCSNTLGNIEDIILTNVPTHDYNDIFGQPATRLAYSVKTCNLLSNQTKKLIDACKTIIVKSDTKEVHDPKIILIIGESYNKHHSQLYGYLNPTTPNQIKWKEKGNLIVFRDVVSSWDLTSYSFKNMMTTYCIGDKGEWCDYPLLGCIMRKSGFYTSFISNQFVPNIDNSICGISGGSFLNDEALSRQQFDYRNSKTYQYDKEMIEDYFNNHKSTHDKEFTIFHFLGQHFAYSMRSPDKFKRFTAEDIKRPDLSMADRQIIADYDNSILYNDEVLNTIIDKYKSEDAVIIYLSDHSERMFGPENGKKYGRQTFEPIDKKNATENFEVPMWIFCTEEYKANHKDFFDNICKAANLPFMTDAIPHMIIHLAGVKTNTYNPERDILSPQFDSKRPRLLRKETDYNSLK